MTAIFHKCLETIELLFDYYNQNEREANEMEELKDNDVEKKIEDQNTVFYFTPKKDWKSFKKVVFVIYGLLR